MNMSTYFTSNQSSTLDELNVRVSPYLMLRAFGQRLRIAMGDEEVLPRNVRFGGEFRVPTFRSYAEALDRNPWGVYDSSGQCLFVVPYNTRYDGWKSDHRALGGRSGFMAVAVNSYEYAYDLWDEYVNTSQYHPDLFDDGTFGVWLGLLPQPVSVNIQGDTATISWAGSEPRIHRSDEMGRYTLPYAERTVAVLSNSWRVARAEAYVKAWEKMAANESKDRYKSVMLAERRQLEESFRK